MERSYIDYIRSGVFDNHSPTLNPFDIVTCVGKPFERDSKVVFNEAAHCYTIEGQVMKRSVTQLVHEFFPAFNPKETAFKMLTRDDFYSLRRYEEYVVMLKDYDLNTPLDLEKAVELVTTSWEKNGSEQAKLGTTMHNTIEKYYTQEDVKINSTPELKMFSDFDSYRASLGFVPFRSEQIVWDLDYSLAGSVDMLYINMKDIKKERPDIWLVDWKRSKEIKKRAYGSGENARGKGPLTNKANCNFEHYSLQLNIYKHLLEKHYSVNITRMTLVILHPNQEGYKSFDVEDNQGAVRDVMKSITK